MKAIRSLNSIGSSDVELTDIDLSTWHNEISLEGALRCRCSEARSRVMTSIG